MLSNTGKFIGFPSTEVDVENEGWPVAIDTAGNVDKSSYALNIFEELNGKCIDLDGFHNGEIRRNRCVNSKPAAQYPYGHYGIVMNNSNPDMESEKVTIIDNELEGMKFGGIFVIGTGHRIEKNRMRNLNTAGCPETQGKVACVYDVQQPDLLQTRHLPRPLRRPQAPVAGQGQRHHRQPHHGPRHEDPLRCFCPRPVERGQRTRPKHLPRAAASFGQKVTPGPLN